MIKNHVWESKLPKTWFLRAWIGRHFEFHLSLITRLLLHIICTKVGMCITLKVYTYKNAKMLNKNKRGQEVVFVWVCNMLFCHPTLADRLAYATVRCACNPFHENRPCPLYPFFTSFLGHWVNCWVRGQHCVCKFALRVSPSVSVIFMETVTSTPANGAVA